MLGSVSQVRSVFVRRLQIVELASFGAIASALFIVFSGAFYAYQMRAEKPDVAKLAGEISVLISQGIGVEI